MKKATNFRYENDKTAVLSDFKIHFTTVLISTIISTVISTVDHAFNE